MKCDALLTEIKKYYRVASVLSERNDGCVLKLVHRQLGKALVYKKYVTPVHAYDLLVKHTHPNLPVIYDSVLCDDGQVVLEEYIEGLTVAQVLQTGLYTRNGATKIIKAVCQAVDLLHKFHVVHRDIKPENIIISSSGHVKLIDLNASRIFSQEKPNDTQVLGTIGYASYEQLGVAQSDERTDIFAIGVLYNVLLTGEHPTKKLAKGRAGQIILKCTQISPDSRYSCVSDLLKAL